MPSIRENVASLIPGSKTRRRMERAAERYELMADALQTVFERRAYYATGQEGIKVEELDSRTIANLLRRANYITITGGVQGDLEDENLRTTQFVPLSRRMQRYDPLTKRIIATWTDFGFGQNIVITPSVDTVQKWWREFWTATRNRPLLGKRELHKSSDRLLIDGEFFYVYFTDKRTGLVTVRTIVTEEITEIVTLPDDDQTFLYYKREWTNNNEVMPKTLYYPDWLATDEQLAQAELPEGADIAQDQDDAIDVDMMQVALTSQTVRGWPLLSASQDWDRAYVDFLQNRAAVSRVVATYVDRVQVKGGSRAVSAFQAQLESALVDNADTWETNPPPAAGSMGVINDAVNWDRFNMSSGASDAEIDGRMLFNMVGIGAGLFPHWLGHGEAYRLATACYSSDTEYLGEDGWKPHWEWYEGEKVASYNVETRQIEYVAPTALHVYEYEGKMLNILGRGVDAFVTPNHRMWALNENNTSKTWATKDWAVMRANELPSRFALPAYAIVEEREDILDFILPGYQGDVTGIGTSRAYPAVAIDMDDWLCFLGWWLAEGSITNTGKCYSVAISVSESDVTAVEELRSLFARFPLKFYRDTSRGQVRWRIGSKKLYRWLKEYCGKGSAYKRLPLFAYGLNARQATILLDAIWRGDGHFAEATHYRGFLTSTSLQLLDDCQILMLHTGYWGGIALQRGAGKHKDFPNSLACYVLHRNEYEKRSLSRSKNVARMDYQGAVWCFEVPPNGMFVTRRNGQPLIAGNTAMEQPILRNFQRYQEFWQSIWQDMYDHVLAMGERYGGQTFKDKAVEIALDPLLQEDLTGLSNALAKLSNVPSVALPAKETTRLVLQALGIDDIEDVLLTLFPDSADGQERAAVRVKDLAAMAELLTEARANGNGAEEIVMAGEAFLDSLR